MQIASTTLADCFIIRDTIFTDDRGYFFESFNREKFRALTNLDLNFVQDNQSSSTYGVLRGLHYQTGEYTQAKLVRVLQGSVLDIAVDIRQQSPTFGKHVAIELTAENNVQLFIPRGFAHGFVVLSDKAVFFYKCDNYYNKTSESGIIYNDPELNIDWKIPDADVILSEKDRSNPLLKTILTQ